jgi:integrase/recombinase XerC
MQTKTIIQAVDLYLKTVSMARSENTYKSYKNAMKMFLDVLQDHGFDPQASPVDTLTEDSIAWMADFLKNYSPATEQLYLVSCVRFFEYLVAEKIADINIQRMRLLLRQRVRRPGQRLPQFPRDEIEKILTYTKEALANIPNDPVIR